MFRENIFEIMVSEIQKELVLYPEFTKDCGRFQVFSSFFFSFFLHCFLKSSFVDTLNFFHKSNQDKNCKLSL